MMIFSFSPSHNPGQQQEMKAKVINEPDAFITLHALWIPLPSPLLACTQLLSFFSAFIDKHKAAAGAEMENQRKSKQTGKTKRGKHEGNTAASCKQRFFCTVKSFQYDVKLVVCCYIKIFLDSKVIDWQNVEWRWEKSTSENVEPKNISWICSLIWAPPPGFIYFFCRFCFGRSVIMMTMATMTLKLIVKLLGFVVVMSSLSATSY